MDGMVGAVARRDDVMARICELVNASDPSDADAFVRSYYGQLGDDDLETWTAEALAQAALEHWRFGAQRDEHEALVRVYTPTRGHTTVDVVLDDMPFLVDSLTMALDRRSLGVHLVVHPILRVRRTSGGALLGMANDDEPARAGEHVLLESWTHIEIDRETSSEILESVRAELASVLRDVGAATRDWKPMLGALQHVADELERMPPPCAGEDLTEGRALLQWLADQHFTFLGSREYRLVADDRLVPVPGSGLGLLRTASEAPSAAPGRRAGQGAREDLARADEGEPALDRSPTYASRLHRDQEVRRAR